VNASVVEWVAFQPPECDNGEEMGMTKAQYLARRKQEWLRQERRDFIDAYTAEWESEGWIAEWEKEEEKLHVQWAVDHPDGTADDWDKWANRQLTIWQAERREALREEAQDHWKQGESEYEKRWEEYVGENAEAVFAPKSAHQSGSG
jgi:hypothetical protein